MMKKGYEDSKMFTKGPESSRKLTEAFTKSENGKNMEKTQKSKKFKNFLWHEGVTYGTSAHYGTRSVRYGTHAFCRPVFGKTRGFTGKYGILSQRPTWWNWNSLKNARKGLSSDGSRWKWFRWRTNTFWRRSYTRKGSTRCWNDTVDAFSRRTVQGPPKGIWDLTHEVGLDARRGTGDSRNLTVRQLTHSWRTNNAKNCPKRLDVSTEMLGHVQGNV